MAPARGRPREFDQASALDGALRIFWMRGLAATSVDDLAAAMGLSKPSLYNAFGGKAEVYRLALVEFVARMHRDVGSALASSSDLVVALNAFFDRALAVYFEASPALGCFAMCTAAGEAGVNEEIREDLFRVMQDVDGMLAKRFALAQDVGQLPDDADVVLLGRLTQGLLHSVALRARAGASRASLQRFARGAVRLLCAGA